MYDLRQQRNFAIDIPDEEITRLLGYGDHPLSDRVRAMLTETQKECRPLLETARSLLRVGPDTLSRSPFLRELEAAVLCLVTTGAGVEKLVEDYDRAGEISRALIANAYGSAAAEAAADATHVYIREQIEPTGLSCSRRFSPGYGGWKVEEQRWLLRVLEGEQLGVTLTAGCMMVPRKSVTFAVSVGVVPTEMRKDNECDHCELADCRYRRKTVINEAKGRKWTTFVAPESNFCPRDKWN